VEKTQKIKKDPILIYLTSLSQREIKKSFSESDKIMCIDVNKIISENFNTDKPLNDIQYWIMNQTIVKKIIGIKGTKIERIYIILKEPNKDSIKSLKELLKENNVGPANIEIYSSDLPS
jgi:hypothetical protein